MDLKKKIWRRLNECFIWFWCLTKLLILLPLWNFCFTIIFIKILFIGDLHGLRAIGVGIKYGVYLLCVQLISKRDLQSKYVLRYEQVKTPYGIRASQIVRSSYGLLEWSAKTAYVCRSRTETVVIVVHVHQPSFLLKPQSQLAVRVC